MPTTFTCLHFRDLSLEQLHALFQLRVDVFVVEQTCPYTEIDGKDPDAWHLLGQDTNGALVCYARVLPEHDAEAPHIGRVVVRKEARGTGLADELMHQCFGLLERLYGSRRNDIAAQAYLERFYQRHGYRTTSKPYDWDGIPHIDMVHDGQGRDINAPA
ncbi:MAG: GNAT family N-acetyltransferase [Flavobacteriales bacterium]